MFIFFTPKSPKGDFLAVKLLVLCFKSPLQGVGGLMRFLKFLHGFNQCNYCLFRQSVIG